MRSLRVVDATRPIDVFEALRDALGGGGPAVVPREGVARATDWPSADERVAQNVALVIETSGSTGRPKRVALSADALLASAAASAGAMGGQGQWLLALPAHYVAGAQVLVRSLAAETEPVPYGDGHFDPQRFADAAALLEHDYRYTSLVPVQLARLVEAAEGGAREVARALRRFDGILVGGQALPPALRERAEAAGARILSTYGSSETAGGCVYSGVPIGTTVVREVDGLLEISGPSLAEGYLGDPDRTAAAFHEEGGARWYRTGDLGTVEDGRVTVLGRSDNVIISGGEKVLLDTVERVVHAVPGFAGAVVVAADDAQWGQVPVVVVAGAPEIGLDDLRVRVADQLGRAAAPARIVTVTVMPRLSSGKPDRQAAARIAGVGGGAAVADTGT
ncbi:AMP-binding protein [Leifsonia sp. NPDC080035]|uniref:AMP-binding protein n=1 Tax=Leifsonia sp. NPDC080035 TaxID=3143936 RepID=A0AAU7GH32_9MICO